MLNLGSPERIEHIREHETHREEEILPNISEGLKRKGVPENQLFVAGYGPNRPLTDNGSPKGKAQNRRVEIVIGTTG